MKRGSENDIEDVGGKLRLFVRARLDKANKIAATQAQAHYLLHVMRARMGARVRLFNGTDGEWQAAIVEIARGSCTLLCEGQTRPQTETPDLWLAFAPIKKTPADYIAQKATELGVRALQPVITTRTVARRVNGARLLANAMEAAEQSERLTVPEVREPVDLAALLRSWPSGRRLLYCDEAGDALPIATALGAVENLSAPWAVLTGPEGGFDTRERSELRALPFVVPVTLGPRIMRADTAALAALAVWQALLGDWH